MKQIITLVLAMSLSWGIYAQQLPPNGDFENWNSATLFEEPQAYASSNLEVIFDFMRFNVSKSTDANTGSYALKMESIANATDSAFGYAMTGKVIGGNFTGGFPMSEIPDSFKANVKYNCDKGDSVAILLLFKRMGNPVGGGFFYLYGQQNSWTEITFPINNVFVKPDSVIIGFASSNPESESTPINPGNWFMVDDISFTGVSAPIPNAGFEDWIPFRSEEPLGWSSLNLVSLLNQSPPSVTKTNDAQSGSFALQITTQMLDLGFIKVPVGIASTGSLVNGELGGGFAIDEAPDSLTFYYKYDNTKNPNDTAWFFIEFSKFNTGTLTSEGVDSLVGPLYASSSYKRMSIPFSLGSKTIDTANIAFSSSSIESAQSVGVGNTLIVDNVKLHFPSSSISLNNYLNAKVEAYPNPANNYLTIEFDNPNNKELHISLLNLAGQKIMQTSSNSSRTDLETKSLPNGQYIYIISDETEVIARGKISVKH